MKNLKAGYLGWFWGGILGAVAMVLAVPHVACMLVAVLLYGGVSLAFIHPALTPDLLAYADETGVSLLRYIGALCSAKVI